ncbi:CGNR zinc finger domain-containing protein [Saccharothrix hoggarensis]
MTPPTASRLGLDLVATVRSRLGGAPRDDLTSPATLAEWLAARGLSPAADPDEVDLREFRALRETAYRLLEVVVDGTRARPADVESVNRWAAHPPPAVRLRAEDLPDGRTDLRAEPVRPTTAQVLGLVARDLVDLVTGPQRDRLHQCEAEVCGSFFVDTSRAGRRRWCSAATCGNRMRVAAHRSRAHD